MEVLSTSLQPTHSAGSLALQLRTCVLRVRSPSCWLSHWNLSTFTSYILACILYIACLFYQIEIILSIRPHLYFGHIVCWSFSLRNLRWPLTRATEKSLTKAGHLPAGFPRKEEFTTTAARGGTSKAVRNSMCEQRYRLRSLLSLAL